MFGIGGFEFLLILVFGFLIFGPDKLPEMAKTAGKAIAKFKNAQEDMSTSLKKEVFDPESDTPFKNPITVAEKKVEEAKTTAKKVDEQVETFSERKARYEAERAARRAAEEAKAAEEAAASTIEVVADEPAAEEEKGE